MDSVAKVEPKATPVVTASAVEFILEGLHLNKRLNRDVVSNQTRYRG